MSDKVAGVIYNLTEPAILAFPNLMTARPFMRNGKPQGEPKFDAQFMLRPDHKDVPFIREGLLTAAKLMFPTVPEKFQWPIHSGDQLAEEAKAAGEKDKEFFRGYFVLISRSKFAPGLSAAVNGRAVDFPMTGEERIACGVYFYGGCHVMGQFNFMPYPGVKPHGVPGVTAYLNIVYSLNIGERNSRLEGGAGKSGSAVFGKHLGQMSAVDPTAGMAAGAAAGLPF